MYPVVYIALWIGLSSFCPFAAASTGDETWQGLLSNADSLWLSAEYDSALVQAQRALEIAERTYGMEDTSVASILHKIGSIYDDLRKSADADIALNRALAIREKKLGPDDPSVAATLNNLGISFYNQGRYPEAELVYLRALDIRKRWFGGDHSAVAGSLTNLANLYLIQGRYSEAAPLYSRALELQERILGPEHPAVASILNSQAMLFQAEGRYSEAMSVLERTLQIRTASLGEEDLLVADVLNNMAIVNEDQGLYSEAESLLERAMSIRESVLGPDHPDYAASLFNLAIVYMRQNRMDEAESLYRRSLQMTEKALGPDHPDVALCLNSIANLLQSTGRFEEAELHYLKALQIDEAALGPEHVEVANVLNNLAILYEAQCRFAEAEPLYERALQIHTAALGPDHPDVAENLDNLAGLLTKTTRYYEAEQLHRKAMAIRQAALGTNHPVVASSLNGLASLLFKEGRYAEAVTLESQALRIRRGNFYDAFGSMTERSALQFSRLLQRETASCLSIMLDSPNGPAVNRGQISDVVFSQKSQVTDGLLTRRKAIITEADSTARKLAEDLQLSRLTLSKLYLDGMGDDDLPTYRRRIQEAIAEKERLEENLARHSASFLREQQQHDVSASAVARALPSGAVLVDFMQYPHWLNFYDTEPRYIAVALKRDGDGIVVPLGSAAAIDSLVSRYRRLAARPARARDTAHDSLASALYRRLLEPMAGILSGAGTILIAPDGQLNLLPFGALKDDRGAYVIESYSIHYVTSARDLLRFQDRPEPGSGLLSFGDPDFESGSGPRVSSTAGGRRDASRTVARRATSAPCHTLSDRQWTRLPGTAREVEIIRAEWARASGETADFYIGRTASEENFKRCAPGKRVLHVATHGYCVPDECLAVPIRQWELPEDNIETRATPFVISGFVLAGANHRDDRGDSSNAEDGFVTAEEVAELDLHGTEMAVLSMCESGLGEVQSAEGVFGLRRAFQLAGVRAVISTLWPVDDATTSEFMGRVFSMRNATFPEIMRQAALSRIDESREQIRADDPYYWAAFIATGDWSIGP